MDKPRRADIALLAESDPSISSCLRTGTALGWSFEEALMAMVIKLAEDRRRMQEQSVNQAMWQLPPAFVLSKEAVEHVALKGQAHTEIEAWIVERWDAEVANRPAENVHRLTLDRIWRQMYRHLTGQELPRPLHPG